MAQSSSLGRRGRTADPGIWSEPRALRGADAVLVTHEHVDHVDALRLRGAEVPVHAPQGADMSGLDTIPVQAGEELEVAGFRVRPVGGQHASVLEGHGTCPNLGYVVDDRLYHPGDALHVPNGDVETLLVPMQASWLKTAEAIAFVRQVAPDRSFAIHDGQINERALSSINGWFSESTNAGYRWLAPGDEA